MAKRAEPVRQRKSLDGKSKPEPRIGILVDIVRISNFRSLKNIEIHFSNLTLLVGANNSGKTSLLKALNLALGVERRVILKEDFYIGKSSENDEPEIKIDLRIVPIGNDGKRVEDFGDLWRDVEFGDLITVDTKDRQYVAFRTQVSYNAVKNDYEIKRFRINDWNEDSKEWEKTEYEDPIRIAFRSVPLFFIDAHRDILEDLRSRTSYLGRLLSKVNIDQKRILELEKNIQSLNDEIVGSSDVLSHLKDRLNELNETIESSGSAVDITPINKKIRDLNKGININFQDAKNESFPLEYHGMGTRSWASLLTFKAYISWLAETFEKDGTQPYHPILALEEPEAHLHPNAQRHLYSQLLSIGGQKIISSHSPYIAGQCSVNEIRHFYKTGTNPKISSFNSEGLSKDDLRKLQREIMHSRGELLFSRAIVLSEGNTEEQALPLFAKHYWGYHPFATGVNFVGVGGSGNYLPFIRFCQSFNIPWFIFSDGEDETIKSLTSALGKLSLDLKATNIKIIPGNQNFEQYLIKEGYQEEIKKGILKSLEDQLQNEKHKEAKAKEINKWNDDQLITYMSEHKTNACSYITESILMTKETGRQLPSLVKGLLEVMSAQLKLNPSS